MARDIYSIKDPSGVVFYSNGIAKLFGGMTVNVKNPQKKTIALKGKNYSVDLFLTYNPTTSVYNSDYNVIGLGVVEELGGDHGLYYIWKIKNPSPGLPEYIIATGETLRLQSFHFVRGKNGNICALAGDKNNGKVIKTTSGEKVKTSDYYFYFSGRAESVKNRGTWFSSWKLNPIEETDDKTYNGGELPEINVTPRMEISDRVGALQTALNAAGYTDNNGRPLVVDRKGGPITQAVAQKAGVDYVNWKVGDPIRPATQQQSATAQATANTAAQSAAQPAAEQPVQPAAQPAAEQPVQPAEPKYTAKQYADAGVAMNNAQNNLNQTKTALINKIDRIINKQGVKKQDKDAAKTIKQCLETGDYWGAMAAANTIYWPRRRQAVTNLIAQNKSSFDAHQTLSQQDIYNDINGGQGAQQTGVNEGRRKNAVMNESKLIDMITYAMLKEL